MPQFICDEMQDYMEMLYGLKEDERIYGISNCRSNGTWEHWYHLPICTSVSKWADTDGRTVGYWKDGKIKWRKIWTVKEDGETKL